MIHRLTTAQSTGTIRRLRPPVLAALAAFVALTALSAGAATPARPTQIKAEAAPRTAGEPIMAIVSIGTQKVTYYDADGWIYRAPVSTGVKGRETPAGVFALIEKDKDHHSTMYDDAWMPNMQRITWNGIALHGGPLPGYAASHGCVRMPYDFAEKLFDKTHIGMRVIIAPNDPAPVAFSASGAVHAEGGGHRGRSGARRDADRRGRRGRQGGRRGEESRRDDGARDEIARGVAAQSWSSSSGAPTPRSPPPTERSTRRSLQRSRTKPRRRPRSASRRPPPGPRNWRRSSTRQKPTRKSKVDAAAAAKDAAKAADTKKTAAVKAATEAKLALEPVSIYISRATQKLYVRRNTHKPWPDGGEVFDASIEVPVTIRDPDRPIGTHVFTAMARDGAAFRWTAVTIDEGDDAKDALDRITIPQDVLASLAPTAAPKILDHRLGRTAEQGDQLPHRVCRGAEQSAARRLHHAQGYASRRPHCERRG